MVGYIIGGVALFIFGGCIGFCIACILSASKMIEDIDRMFESKEDNFNDDNETC
jgi:hypothetical protein